jgi:hypothetical protein
MHISRPRPATCDARGATALRPTGGGLRATPHHPRSRLLVAALLVAPAIIGCGEKPKPSGKAAGTSTASSSTTLPAATVAAKPKGMPDLLVDPEGPYLAGQRIDLVAAGGTEKLATIVKGLPIEGAPVTLVVEKKAKVSAVAAVVSELGKAGAPKVIIKTDGRDDLPKELTVTPESKVSSPPGCSVVVMVLKDVSTAVWPLKGGLGKRHRKGFAGPDLSHTGDALTKDIDACDSKMAFFSGEDALPWEMSYNLAATVLGSDAKKKIDTLVLLKDTPVAGRAVALGK